MKFLTVFIILGVALQVWAKDGGGNAGDPVALEFIQEAQVAISLMKENQSQFAEVPDLTKLSTILSNAGIYVVNEPCEVEKNQITQTPVACNVSTKQTISIYRGGWTSIYDLCIRRGTAAHEVLSLANIETTGDYHLSQKLVAVCRASDHSAERDAVVTALRAFANDNPPYLGLASASSQPSGNWVSGPAVSDQEKQRLTALTDAAAGFRELPYNNQLDMLVTGVAGYTPFKLSRGHLLYETAELDSFGPMTEWLASDLNTYVMQIDHLLSLYKKEGYEKFSDAGKKKLDELILISKKLVAVVDHESHDGGKYYKKMKYVVPTTPYSDYLKAIVNQMRKYVAQNGCQVPTTFKTVFYADKAQNKINESLSTANLDLQNERLQAEKAGDDFIKQLVDLSDQWVVLAKAENLDRITFDGWIPLGSKDVAADTSWIMSTTYDIASKTREQFKEDSKVLPKILQKLESGSLCIK